MRLGRHAPSLRRRRRRATGRNRPRRVQDRACTAMRRSPRSLRENRPCRQPPGLANGALGITGPTGRALTVEDPFALAAVTAQPI
jgi:hypothetical protein